MKSWFVYLARCSDDSLYCGITTNLERRIAQHNKGIGAKYTKSRRPVVLFKAFTFPDRSNASKEEYRIKQLSRKEKLKL